MAINLSKLEMLLKTENGDEFRFVLTSVAPFGIDEIQALDANQSPSFNVTMQGENCTFNGLPPEDGDSGKVQMSINFAHAPRAFALVSGGWLPPPLVTPPNLLVDRNVLASLKNFRAGKVEAGASNLNYWMSLMSDGRAVFNPLPYAIEGAHRRSPSYSEFAAAFREGVSELEATFPKCKIINLDSTGLKSAHALATEITSNNSKEIAFLTAICPILALTIPRKRELNVLDTIIDEAKCAGVDLQSLVVIAACSILFESISGSQKSIGRKVLKPNKSYSVEDAYNSISDLRHIELVARVQAAFGADPYALCTCDKGLAMLWTELSPSVAMNGNSVGELDCRLTTGLFPRLSSLEVERLSARLGEQVVKKSFG